MKNPDDCNNTLAGNNKHWLVILSVLVVIGSIQRIYSIDGQSLWSDELYAVIASYKTAYSDVWRLMLGDSHPPGYLSFMYWTLPLAGYSDAGIRFHAFFFGVLWIPLVFWFGCRRFGPIAGILAAAIVASSYNAVYYSQEARAYTMFVVAGLVNLFYFFEILFGESGSRRHTIWFIVATSAMLYLHYSGFVFICAEILLYVLLWASRLRPGSIKECLLAFGVPFLLYIPWMGIMYANLTSAPQDWSVSKPPTLAETYNTMHRLLGPDDGHMKAYVLLLPTTLLWVVIEQVKHGLSKKLLLIYSLFFLMAVPVLAFYIESLIGTPIFEKRYFLLSSVIAMLLVAVIGSHFMERISPSWKMPIIISGIIIFTSWTVNANIAFGLYSKNDKDPVREAVAIIKKDVEKNPLGKHYTTIMTHDWFEHYLKQSKIIFDPDWEFRKYYVPQQIGNIEKYLADHNGKAYLYYLSLRQPNSEAALVALKQEYKLLSQAEVSIDAGTIDVFKFSTREEPDAAQLQSVGSNPSNEVAKLVAKDLVGKDPKSYLVLMTHDWVKPYLLRNGVIMDSGNPSYVIDAQAGGVFDYLSKHPDIDTVYYLALQEPNAEGAAFVLQSNYKLTEERSVQTSVGKMNVLKFDVKAPPVISESLLARMNTSPTSAVPKWILDDAGVQHDTYSVITANQWIKPYLKQANIPVDAAGLETEYSNPMQTQSVIDYYSAHPDIRYIYYVALDDEGSKRAAELLETNFQLAMQTSIDIPSGKISIYKFDSKASTNNTEILKETLKGNQVFSIVNAAALDAAQKNRNAVDVVMSHNWFQPYIKLHNINFDKQWNGRFLGDSNQLVELDRHLREKPAIEYLYYFALSQPGTTQIIETMKQQFAVGCQQTIEAPMGQLMLIRFDVKLKPLPDSGAVTRCSGE